MKPGITQLILPKLTMSQFLTQSAEAGYQAVELALRSPGQGEFTTDTSDEALATIVKTAADLNLDLDSLVHGQVTAATGSLLESGERQQKAIEQTIAGLHVARKLGIRCTLHTLGGLTPDLYYEDAWNNAVASLKQLAVTCDEIDVDIAIEFVWSGFLFSPLEMRRLLEEVGSPRIGFYFDPGNMAVFQYPQHWVRALGQHTKRVHVKDWQGRALKGGWTALLKGEVDFPVVMAELRKTGFDGALTSEVSTADASLQETAQAITAIINM